MDLTLFDIFAFSLIQQILGYNLLFFLFLFIL